MNLAEIRKKAQKDEPRQQGGGAQPEPGHASAEAAQATPEAAPASAAQPAARPLAADLPVPADYQWLEEPAAEEFPDEFLSREPELFDPAAAILKGRESGSFEEQAAAEEERQGASTLELLCFKVADEEYAISIMDIKEIIKPREVTEVPRAPEFVRGILSLRGIIIPIYDVRVRLGLEAVAGTGKARVIVVKRENGFCGVLVDEVVQVVRVQSAGIEPPPAVLDGIDRDFVAGIGRVSGRMLILLDMEKVLDVALV